MVSSQSRASSRPLRRGIVPRRVERSPSALYEQTRLMRCLARRRRLHLALPYDAPDSHPANNRNAMDRRLPPRRPVPHPRPADGAHRPTPDVLAEIFQRCLRFDGLGALNQPAALPLEALALSHVSSRWRSAAFSQPALWSSIWVDRPRAAHIPMVETWLERSQQNPLLLYLRQTPDPGTPHPFTSPNEAEFTERVLELFGAQFHRWRRVTFFFTRHAPQALLRLPTIPNSAPLLQHVHLVANEHWSDADKHKVERILHARPSLISITLHASTTQKSIPWIQLTELDTNQMGCAVVHYVAVLRLCRSLTRVELRILPDAPDAPFIRPSLRAALPKLESLTVHLDHADVAPLLDCLVAPALKSLVLRYRRAFRQSNDPHALHLLLQRSGAGCILRRFCLADTPRTREPDSGYYLAFLQSPQMVGLTELSLNVELSDAIMRFLTLGAPEDGPGTPRFLPALETIALSDLTGEHHDDLELYRMVVSRLGRPLRSAYFHLCLKGHSSSPVLPLLFERCWEKLDLRVYLAPCDDAHSSSGWYKAEPIPGGYLTDA
ncbi:hypothetical protein MKEN_00000200 [Mycena kentingensis (nom. inval.)]|nr:hypothetical protein MKEN_00000200 [Mycena kentingensis (nom. inval.)]